jgi:lysophospholipase L1-like esterase
MEKSRKNADNMVKWGHIGHTFGMPEHVKPFAAMLKTLAGESNCFYIDLYTPTQNTTNRNGIFVVDGVHLTPAGNRLLASELLKAIAGEPEILK